MIPFVFSALGDKPWFGALVKLQRVLAERDKDAALEAYTLLYRALQETAPDLPTAVSEALLWEDSSLAHTVMISGADLDVPAGLKEGALQDLESLLTLSQRNWQGEATRLLNRGLPPLSGLSSRVPEERVATLARSLEGGDARWLLGRLLEHYRSNGAGILARFRAFRWVGGTFQGVAHPAELEMEGLVGLGRPLGLLTTNVEAFLEGKPAQHTLLYGPRGSGKSTAVKSLLPRYAARGLRLVELPPAALPDLPEVIEGLRGRPQRFVLFVDDLSFGEDDTFAPLKTLLEGSLVSRPVNILVCATSNRRHLVKESFSDRPDPLNDDVHGWDTQNERLALADRFGLTLTFPNATQARFLDIVRGLAVQEGLTLPDLEARAVRFAEWGNGYSGRTAQQFIDGLKAELA